MRFRLLVCRCRGWWRCLLISSSRHLVVRCRPALPACLRLVFPSSRPISSLVVSLVVSPLFDTVGRGVRRGASVSCLLGFCPAVCADADSRFMRYLVGLLAYQIGAAGAMAFSSRPSSRPCGMCCDALLAHRLVSRLARRPVGLFGSVFLSPRLATRLAGRRADAVRLFVSRSILPLLACLGLFLAIHLIRMAAAVCGLSARRALLACPVVSVPCRSFRLGSRPLHPLARSIDADRCRCPDVIGVGMGSGAVLPYCVFSHPVPVLLRELVKTARAGMVSLFPLPFRLPMICVSPRPAVLPSRMCLLGG